jgi:hypothetical protein
MISQCLGNMIGQRLTLRTLSLLTSRSLKEEGKRREERASLRSPIYVKMILLPLRIQVLLLLVQVMLLRVIQVLLLLVVQVLLLLVVVLLVLLQPRALSHQQEMHLLH